MADIDIDRPPAADSARISQLLSNLLGNALHHGASDHPVRVTAGCEGGQFLLTVANAGPPIPPDAMGRLFQPFYRPAEETGQDGLGLGLYIAHEIAKAHGGQIDVVSDHRETRFTYRMPLAFRSGADRAAAAMARPAPTLHP